MLYLALGAGVYQHLHHVVNGLASLPQPGLFNSFPEALETQQSKQAEIYMPGKEPYMLAVGD